MDSEITAAERAEALRILEMDNEGAGMDSHTRAYFGFVAYDVPGVHPVRSATGGIIGYRRDSVTADIDRFTAKETEHLAAAEVAASPEMRGAQHAAAQEYAYARMTRETDAAYAAQTFLVAAQEWARFMPEPLREVHSMNPFGKPTGSLHSRAQQCAGEADAAAARILAVGAENLAKRLDREATATAAAAMSDKDLAAAVTAEQSTPRFLVLVRERDERSAVVRKAKSRAQRIPASTDPWTAAEERMLTATAAQTAGMDLGQLQGYRDAFAPSNLSGRTRMDQLKYESITRELDRREAARVAAQELLTSLPVLRKDSGSFGPMRDQGSQWAMDPADRRRLGLLDLAALVALKDSVTAALDAGQPTREQRTAVSRYLRAVRDRIAVRKAEQR